MSKPNRGNMGLRVIVFMGAATFLFLMLMAFGLKKSLQPQAGNRVPSGAATSPFQEDRAWDDLQFFQGRGAAASGSPAVKARQDYVTRELREAGLKVRRFAFEGQGESGAIVPMTSVAGIVDGSRPGIIILCGAVNSPRGGADASGANTAWLLELARTFGERRDGRSVWMVFLDGEVGSPEGSGFESFQGGRHLVEALKASGELAAIDAAIAVDGIGDCSLGVLKESGGPPELIEILWNTAAREGYEKHFGKLPARVRGSQLAFREAGIPALALSDRNSAEPRRDAGSDASPGGACRESLRAVGDVIYHALAPIEGHLDETGTRNNGQ